MFLLHGAMLSTTKLYKDTMSCISYYVFYLNLNITEQPNNGKRKKVNKTDHKSQPSEKTREIMREVMATDIELYKWLGQRFDVDYRNAMCKPCS